MYRTDDRDISKCLTNIYNRTSIKILNKVDTINYEEELF
jgi:hypothetical protein